MDSLLRQKMLQKLLTKIYEGRLSNYRKDGDFTNEFATVLSNLSSLSDKPDEEQLISLNYISDRSREMNRKVMEAADNTSPLQPLQTLLQSQIGKELLEIKSQLSSSSFENQSLLTHLLNLKRLPRLEQDITQLEIVFELVQLSLFTCQLLDLPISRSSSQAGEQRE